MIRDAEEQDLDALAALMSQVQDIHAKELPDIFRSDFDADSAKSMFRDALAKRDHTIFVAEHEGHPIGYVWFEIFDRPATFYHHPRRGGYIHHIGVSASVRHQGTGRALVDAACSRLADAGVSEVGVDYWAFNTRASQFFASLGFEPQRHIAFAPVSPGKPRKGPTMTSRPFARASLISFTASLALAASGYAQPTLGVQSMVLLTLGTDGDAEKRIVRYECEGREPFAVEYINAAPNFLALVPVDGETLVFSAVLSASGARYAAAHWEWWTSGPEASLHDLTLGPDSEPVATCLEFTETP